MHLSELPTDVVELIFHQGCKASSRFCQSLCLVSSWTRRLALPYLYSTVILRAHLSIISFSSTVTQKAHSPNLPPARLQVRRLWIDPISYLIVDIYAACTNLQYLCIHEENLVWLIRAPFGTSNFRNPTTTSHGHTIPDEDFHLWVTKIRSPKWFLQVSDSIATSLPSPFLSRITHLRLDCPSGYGVLKKIKSFVRLSHLAVGYDGSPHQDLRGLVENLRLAPLIEDLRFLIILMVDVLSSSQRAQTLSWLSTLEFPPRIYVLGSRKDDLQKEWEDEVKYGLSIWKKAELHTKEIFGRGL